MRFSTSLRLTGGRGGATIAHLLAGASPLPIARRWADADTWNDTLTWSDVA